MVYADDVPRERPVPVGLTCRFCERTDCSQRAAPSYKFPLTVDENVKKDNFFSPHVDADAPPRKDTMTRDLSHSATCPIWAWCPPGCWPR
jgi:hypothetical protein